MKRKRYQRSQRTRQHLIRYVITVIGYAVVIAALIFGAWRVCSRFIWYETDPLYQLLVWVKEYIWLWGALALVGGWLLISYQYIAKPMRYLDEVVSAAEELAQPGDSAIVLPVAIKNIQDDLNLVREEALRNAMLAREAEQRKNDLIVYLAHDLKTPLTSVIGYLTLLRDEPQISQELRSKYNGIALDKAERLENLVNEFFDITRFNLTDLTLDQERVNLSRMLEQITSEFIPVLEEKELEWDLQIASDVEMICDSEKLERVFDNLIRNAANYSYTKTKVSLVLEQTEERVRIDIRNHGKTVSSEKLERIFEQFFRLDSSRATSSGGAGLGLAIAKEIVELHGGTIGVESAEESITFTVQFPITCHKVV